MPTLPKRATWCITPRNWEYFDNQNVPRVYVQNVVVPFNFSENIFPLEGNVLFFGADVQTADNGIMNFKLLKNGSTVVATLPYAATETGIKGVVLDAVYFEDDWWNLAIDKVGSFVVRVGFMIAGKL